MFMRKWLCVVLCFFGAGCTYFSYKAEMEHAPVAHRSHGVVIYNLTKQVWDEYEKHKYAEIIYEAYTTLVECAGIQDEDVKNGLLKTRFIIVPSLFFIGGEVDGLTDIQDIFIRKDQFFHSKVRHELIHVYLFLTGKATVGNLLHTHSLFKKCEY